MEIGDVYYSFKNLMPYEVVRETEKEFYLCRFDGTCSDIDMVSKNKPPRYAETEREAARGRIFELRQEIKAIEGIYL